MLKTNTPGAEQIKSRNSQKSADGDQLVNLAIVILARNEEKNIGRFLQSLEAQTLFDRGDMDVSLYVVANGCSDRTAQIAREAASKALHSRGVKSKILDWATPGKSRSWNRVVHEVLPSDVDYVLAMDADIEFVDDFVLTVMFDLMRGTTTIQVLSGSPIKDSVRKSHPTLVDRFSTRVSNVAGYSDAICGQLYLAKFSCLGEIWLPNETPGEDGFLNAMVRTRGFSQASQPDVVMQMSDPTHYYESHSVAAFFTHEKRMIVGTMINHWIFEYLISLQLSEPAGLLIESLNRDRPDWVDKLIEKKSKNLWLIPIDLLCRRLVPRDGFTKSYLLYLPTLFIATVLTLPPALMANWALKKRGAASLW